jgi:calcineurin-like phosphoesterase family protein
MIERHNEVITDNDIVLMPGDLSANLRGRQEHFSKLLKLLRGKKFLIRGNHDHEPNEFYLNAGFLLVVDCIEIGEYFINHYPCFETQWTSKREMNLIKIMNLKKRKVIIHGHTHGQKSTLKRLDGIERINVCVDYLTNNYYPKQIHIPKIEKLLISDYVINKINGEITTCVIGD